MMIKKKEKVYSVASIVLMLDQFVKLLVRKNMSIGQEITIIPKFFSLYYIKNTGAAFSILKNQSIILIIISIVMIYLINKFIITEKKINYFQLINIGLILGGIFGNLIDRIIYRGVTDYLSFTIFSYDFPVFNFADMAIMIGTILLIIDYFKRKNN